MVIAALLHDAVEDEGGLPRLRDIEAKFGSEVAKIVEGCTDSFESDPDKKQERENRKSFYINRIREEPEEWKELCSCQQPTSCTTLVQSLRTTENSERRFGNGSSEAATNNFGTSKNCSRSTRRDARTGESSRNSST